MQKFVNIDPVGFAGPSDYAETKLYPVSPPSTASSESAGSAAALVAYSSKQAPSTPAYVTVSPASVAGANMLQYSSSPPEITDAKSPYSPPYITTGTDNTQDDRSNTTNNPMTAAIDIAPSSSPDSATSLFPTSDAVRRAQVSTLQAPSALATTGGPASARRPSRAEREPKTIKKTNI